MWAEPTFISALCEAGLSTGHPLHPVRREAKALPLEPVLPDRVPLRSVIIQADSRIPIFYCMKGR